MGAKTLVESPCPYMHSKQTGKGQGLQVGTNGHDNCSPVSDWSPPLSTEVEPSLQVSVVLHLAPSLPLVPRTPGAGLEAADVSMLC